MGRGRTKKIQAAIIVSVVAMGATGAFAQNSPVSANLSLTTSLDANTNPGLVAAPVGTVFDLSENLAFSLSFETSTQLFEIFGGAGLSFSSTVGGGSVTSFTTPNLTLHYLRGAAASNFDATANYWSGEVISTFDVDPSAATSLIVDVGTLTILGASAAYNWGLNAPLGFSLNASHDMRDYAGTTDPALFDTTTNVLSASANLRVSPVTQGSVTVTKTDFVSADELLSASTETTRYRFGISHELGRALMLDGNVGYQEKLSTVAAATTRTSGIFGGVNVTQTLPNGSIFGGLQFDETGGTKSSSLNIGRSLDLPLGTLSADLTADWSGGAGAQILGRASYTRQMPDGSMSVDFSQNLTTNSLSEDIKFSKLGIGYQKSLNGNSGLNLNIDVSRTEDAGGGAAATLNRASLTASYSRALTPDWGLAVGYTHLQNTGSAIATAKSDKVFLRLTRDIQFGF